VTHAAAATLNLPSGQILNQTENLTNNNAAASQWGKFQEKKEKNSIH